MIGIIVSKMSSSRHFRLLLTGLSGALILLGLAPAGASSANISHSYESSSSISTGSIVSLDPTSSDFVEAASTDNGVRVVGVAVGNNESLLAVDETAGKVQVATSGNAKTLVSTLSGDIKVGDQIAVSPFKGVGMKAVNGSRIIGLAQSEFNNSTQGANPQEVTNKDGAKKQVSVGFANVSIAIGVNNTGTPQNKLSTLQRLGRSITGHTVSTLRVLMSIVVAMVAIIALVTLVYASIYGGIISIGRNPLAKYAVFRTVGAVMAMVAVTAIVAGVTIFFLLR